MKLKLFLSACVALFLIGQSAQAVTDPYQYITPTGVGSTDTAAINAALPTCVAGKAIFILPGTAVLTSTIDLRSFPGCSISGTMVGTPWGSTQGLQNTTVDCSALGVPCFTMGNSQVLKGFSILGNGSAACLDLSTSTASGNLFLDMVFRSCLTAVDLTPASCCSQNNRFLNNWVESGTTGHSCGANCRFNQFSDIEVEGAQNGYVCHTSCSGSQINQYRAEDFATGMALFGSSDTVVTNYMTNREVCFDMSGSNVVVVRANCSAVENNTTHPCIYWNSSSIAQSSVIIRNITCTGNPFENQNVGTGSVVCNNCLLDMVWNVSTDGLYDNAATEASLDWQRPLKTQYLQAVALTGTTTSSAPDFQNSPNVSFSLTVASATIANPVYAHDGDRGIIELTQDATGGRTVTWSGGYTVTTNAVLNSTLNTTTFYPYTISGTQVILGNSWHN